MGHDPARAATVGALALLLLVTATLFPVVGFGSYPAADRVGSTEGDAGPAVPTETGPTPAVGTSTPDDESAPGTARSTPTDTPTPTETPTDTPTATATPEDDDADLGFFAWLLGGSSSGLFFGLFGGLGVWLLASVLVVFTAGVGTVAVRMTADVDVPDGRLPRVRLFLTAIPRATVAVLVGTGSFTATLGGVATGSLGTLTTGSVRGVADGIAALGSAVIGVADALGSISIPSLGGLASGVSLSRTSQNGGESRSRSRAATATESGASGGGDTVSPPETVREAWARFPGFVPALQSRPETRTPGELARRAVAAGLPREPVETLTAAFRRVRYADGVDDRREADALDAFEELRGTDDSDDGESTDDPGDDTADDGGDES